MISGLKDIDREILKHVNDKELLRICSIDRKTWYEVCDDAFLRRRLTSKYLNVENYKTAEKSWKRFFLDVVNYILILKEKYNFTYSDGNIYTQYSLFREYDINKLLVPATRKKELSVIKHATETSKIFSKLNDRFELPHATYYRALWTAEEQENTKIVAYLKSKH